MRGFLKIKHQILISIIQQIITIIFNLTGKYKEKKRINCCLKVTNKK